MAEASQPVRPPRVLSPPLPAADGAVRVDAIRHLPAVLREVGLDPDATIESGDLDPRVFDDPEGQISTVGLGRLLALAVARSGCRHIGIRVGERTGCSSLGLVGLLTRHSPDVGTALGSLTAHLHLRDRGAVAPLIVAGGTATFGYEVYQPGVEACDQICDGAMAIVTNVLRELCGAAWRPAEVLFAHTSPSDLRPFRQMFGAPLRFDAERTALVFPSRDLERPTRGADPKVFRRLAGRVALAESAMPDDLVARLRRMLRTMLLSGKGSVAEVASRTSMHRRTLNRRLQAHGTTLHRLVEETRFEIARQLVENTRIPLTEIAAILAYADASAFTRAFRRWTGTAPNRWRAAPHGVAEWQAVRAAAAYAPGPRSRQGPKRRST